MPSRNSGRKLLIVNADDCNLTRGVTRSILEAHAGGIVTSTTFLINLPVADTDVRRLKRSAGLGIGLHLNITLGSPVSSSSKIPSLTDGSVFKKKLSYCTVKPAAAEVYLEYETQIKKFKKVFGRLPTHLDTHHQLHDEVFFMKVLSRLARAWKLPVRRSVLIAGKESVRGLSFARLKTTDFLEGNLDPSRHWRKTTLLKALKTVSSGVTEIMCHPGYDDRSLESISSFTSGRQTEYEALVDPAVKSRIRTLGIELTHYGLCYT